MAKAKGKKVVERIEGWEPLPSSLKILFALLLINASASLLFLGKLGFFLFGFILRGTLAIAGVLLLDFLGAAIFLAAMWKRYNWAYKYGMAYLGVFVLNTLAALASPNAPLLTLGIQLMLNLVFIWVLMKEKNYFE